MTEEVNVGMGAPAPKKGMSKGCLVGIIIAAVLILLVISFFVIAYVYKTEIVKFGTSMTLNSSKMMLAESNVEGVDTTAYNKIIDDFNKELEADTISRGAEADSINFVQISNIFTLAQSVMVDKKIDSAEVTTLLTALYNQYPAISPDDLIEDEMIDSLETE